MSKNEALKASELIAQLKKLMEKHGDCSVVTDWDIVREVSFRPADEWSKRWSNEPWFILSY